MAGSINKVTLLGNLGNDPEVRMSQDGSKIVTFSLATSDVWNDKQTGERKERTEWHRVVVFNDRLADVVEKYVRKGSKLYIEGQLQTRKWQDNNGVEKYTTEVVLSRFKGELVLIDSRSSGDNNDGFTASSSGTQTSQPGTFGSQAPSATQNQNQQNNAFGLDDEIPF